MINQFVLDPASLISEGESDYNHSFGGVLEDVIWKEEKQNCQLLCTIDTEDPLCPVKIKGFRYLPLITCHQYNASAISYRLTEKGVKIDYLEDSSQDNNFPYENYPVSWKKQKINLSELTEESYRVIREYSKRQKQQKDFHTTEEYSELVNVLGYGGAQLGGVHDMPQGVPEVQCFNKNCIGSTMDVFGVLWNEPIAGVYLWEKEVKYRDDCTAQIIYQICSNCSSIHSCNR